jgi:hypothetical protein
VKTKAKNVMLKSLFILPENDVEVFIEEEPTKKNLEKI